MDNYGRRQGGGVNYGMPFYEDGSTYSHADPVYQYVSDNYTPEVWNSIPPDTQHILLQNALAQVAPVANAGIHPMQAIQNENWAWGNQNMAMRPADVFTKQPLQDALAGFAQYSGSPAQQLSGLFGGGDSPVPIAYTPTVAQPSAQPPVHPSLDDRPSFVRFLHHLMGK